MFRRSRYLYVTRSTVNNCQAVYIDRFNHKADGLVLARRNYYLNTTARRSRFSRLMQRYQFVHTQITMIADDVDFLRCYENVDLWDGKVTRLDEARQ